MVAVPRCGRRFAGARGPLPAQVALAVAALALGAGAHAGRQVARPEACATPASAGDEEGLRFTHELGSGARLCLRADPGVELDPSDGSVRELPAGRSLRLASAGSGRVLELTVRSEAGSTRHDWAVSGEPRPFDAGARRWMEDALQAAAGLREIAATRAEAERLNGEIDSVRERERRLRDEIGAILAERGRLQRQIGAIRAEERELRDEIGTIRGEESALHAAIGAEGAAIASLTEELEKAAEGPSREDLQAALGRSRASLEELEARLRDGAHAERVAALEARLAGLGTGERVAAIEESIAELDADERIAELERRSQSLQAREVIVALRRRLDYLDPGARIARLEARLQPVLRRIEQAVRRPEGPG